MSYALDPHILLVFNEKNQSPFGISVRVVVFHTGVNDWLSGSKFESYTCFTCTNVLHI